jgi:hypothetical protein
MIIIVMMMMMMMLITSAGDKLNVFTSTGFGSVTIFRSQLSNNNKNLIDNMATGSC